MKDDYLSVKGKINRKVFGIRTIYFILSLASIFFIYKKLKKFDLDENVGLYSFIIIVSIPTIIYGIQIMKRLQDLDLNKWLVLIIPILMILPLGVIVIAGCLIYLLITKTRINKSKTHWYLLSVMILGIILFLIYQFNLIPTINSDFAKINQEHQIKTKENITKINNITTFDFIKLNKTKYNIRGKFIKIENVKQDSVLIKKVFTDLDYDDKISHMIENYYLNNYDNLESYWIPKNYLKNAIIKDYKSISNNEDLGVDFFNDGEKYIIDYIETIDGSSIIKSYGVKGLMSTNKNGIKSNKTIDIGLLNFGYESELINIKNTINKINWLHTFPKKVRQSENVHDYFIISGNDYDEDTEFEAILYFKNEMNKISKYKIKGKNFDLAVEKIKD